MSSSLIMICCSHHNPQSSLFPPGLEQIFIVVYLYISKTIIIQNRVVIYLLFWKLCVYSKVRWVFFVLVRVWPTYMYCTHVHAAWIFIHYHRNECHRSFHLVHVQTFCFIDNEITHVTKQKAIIVKGIVVSTVAVFLSILY